MALLEEAMHAWCQPQPEMPKLLPIATEACLHGPRSSAYSCLLLPTSVEVDAVWVQTVQQQMEDTMRAQEEMTRRLAALEHRPDQPMPEGAARQVRMSH